MVGVVLKLAVWFGLHVVFASVYRVAVGPASLYRPDFTTFDGRALALVALAATLVFVLKQGIGRTLALCAAAGLALSFL